jgi:hypothetical protein
MFKKSLLAASLALVAMNASAAVTSTATGAVDVFGKEFVANEATGIDFSTIEVELNAQYSVGDIVTLSMSGASFDLVNSAAIATYSTDLTSAPTMTLGLLSTDANTATFRITAASGNHGDAETLKFSKITFTALKLSTATAKVAGTVSAVFAAQTSTGISIDAASTNTVAAMKGVTQYLAKFTLAADKLNAEVKVGALRTNFGTGVYDDALKVTFTDYAPLAGEAAVAALVGAAPTGTKVTLNGDFSFLDTNADGKITSADKIFPVFAQTAGTTATTIVAAADLQSVSFVGPTAFTAAGLTITAANVAGDTVIKDQKFTVDTEITYTPKTGGAVKAVASQSAGAWTLDGANQDIAFLPFGNEYAQSVTVSNSGTVEGAITVALSFEGTTFTKTLTAVAAKLSVTNISLEVAALAAESGITGNAQINVIVNAPAASIDVKGVYYHKASQDRVLTK